jgi:hypothetical protein
MTPKQKSWVVAVAITAAAALVSFVVGKLLGFGTPLFG